MPKKADILSTTAVKDAKPGSSTVWLTDGASKGLVLAVYPDGRKRWFSRYSWCGKRTFLALGAWPGMDLATARKANQSEVLQPLADGRSPKTARTEREHRLAMGTFRLVAERWLSWRSAKRASSSLRLAARVLERYVYPSLGDLPLEQITHDDVFRAVDRVVGIGFHAQAARVRTVIRQVFSYGKKVGLVDRVVDCPRPDVPKSTNRAALTQPKDLPRLGEVLALLEEHAGHIAVRTALWCAPRLFVRPQELCSMRWADIDEDRSEWRFRASKTGTEMIVPLAGQVLKRILDLKPFTGHGEFVFSCGRGSHLNTATLRVILRTLGIGQEEQTVHGWRATARTFLMESLDYRREWIEMQLGHGVRDANGTAYNRAQWLPQRAEMMQRWADWLDDLAAGKKAKA